MLKPKIICLSAFLSKIFSENQIYIVVDVIRKYLKIKHKNILYFKT